MSRSSKHPNKKQPKILGFIPKRLWPVVVLVIGVLAITGVVLLISQESALPEGYMPKVSDAPALEVEQPFFELGDMHYNVPANVTYVLRNVGDQPLRILDVPQVKVLEGCCPPTPTISSMVITPGRTATIALQFSMHEGMDGPHDFRMQLKTNDPATPSTELGVRSNWVP